MNCFIIRNPAASNRHITSLNAANTLAQRDTLPKLRKTGLSLIVDAFDSILQHLSWYWGVFQDTGASCAPDSAVYCTTRSIGNTFMCRAACSEGETPKEQNGQPLLIPCSNVSWPRLADTKGPCSFGLWGLMGQCNSLVLIIVQQLGMKSATVLFATVLGKYEIWFNQYVRQ